MDVLSVYTDGACIPNPGRGSWAWVVDNSLDAWMPAWKSRGWKKKKGDIKNLDLWFLLDETISQSKSVIDISWVRGHSGIPGNEKADILALETLRLYSKDSFTTSSRYSSLLTTRSP